MNSQIFLSQKSEMKSEIVLQGFARMPKYLGFCRRILRTRQAQNKQKAQKLWAFLMVEIRGLEPIAIRLNY